MFLEGSKLAAQALSRPRCAGRAARHMSQDDAADAITGEFGVTVRNYSVKELRPEKEVIGRVRGDGWSRRI